MKRASRYGQWAVSGGTLLALAALVAAAVPLPRRGSARGEGALTELMGRTAVVPGLGMKPAVNYHNATKEGAVQREPFCSSCHLAVPHVRPKWTMAMLNQHATRMHCLVCHGRAFVDTGRDLGWKDNLLWPRVDGGWLDSGTEKAWRERAARERPCFSTGPSCAECHREDGPLKWRELGYDEKRAAHLGRLEEFLIRPPEEKWFFPSIL